MIVRCPECSTGFKLPDDQLTQEGVKLRCSKCDHVFRFRETPDGSTEVFYKESDHKRNETGDSSVDDGEEARELERSGAPFLSNSNKSKSKKKSQSASSNYNPFPHADLGDDDDEPQQEPAGGGGLDLSDDGGADGDDDPFGGAFDEEGEDDEEDILQARSAPRQASPSGPGSAKPPPGASNPAPVGASRPPGAAGPSSGASQGAPGAAQSQPAEEPDDKRDVFAQQESPYRPEEMVDPSFGSEGPAFDPDQGVVDDGKPTNQGARAPGRQGAQSPGPGQTPRAQRRQQAAPSSAAADNFGASAASSVAEPTGATSSAWVDDDVGDPIAPHTVGGSGVQKVANFVLITLLVASGFFGVLAYLSDGFIDFQRFDHMLEVAFEGADFEPRSEWTDDGPQVVPAPEDPVRFEGIFATPLQIGDKRVILVRGKARNVGEDSFESLQVRGMLRDSDERVITETKVPLGADFVPSDLSEAESVDEALDEMPDQPTGLADDEQQTFSLIFDDVPEDVFEDLDVSYKVEIADAKPAQ
ncbi:MAG: zinc-ribbon domain-containing protein [Persicimonas sp.]